MGAWGPGVFENDGALDWVDGLSSASLSRALQLAPVGTYLDADDGSAALAAAAVVAAWRRPGRDVPQRAEDWIRAQPAPPSAELVAAAAAAVDRVCGAQSELASLWGVHPGRVAVLQDLRAALGP